MWHSLGKDDGEFDETADDLLGIVFVPLCLVYMFLLPFLRNRIVFGGRIVQKVLYNLLRTFVVAFHQVTATCITIHFNGTVVLVKNLAFLGANSDSYIQTFEII